MAGERDRGGTVNRSTEEETAVGGLNPLLPARMSIHLCTHTMHATLIAHIWRKRIDKSAAAI